MVGLVCLVGLVSLRTCASVVGASSSVLFRFGGSDGQARRMLFRSSAQYFDQQHHFPLSVRDEQDDFEAVPHPANDGVAVALPRFYLSDKDGAMQAMKPGFRKKTADMVGSTTVEGSRDFSVRTIYVGIASYRDWHCR